MDPITIVYIVLGSIAAVSLVSALGWLFLVTPCTKRRSEMERYKSVKFAHRGLHDGGRAENSMSAFKAAKDAGFGIELDVRLSADGQLVVFHDATLARVCGVEGKVIDYTVEQLAALDLSNTGEGIPTFKDVLKLIDGAVPLLIEIKQDTDESGVAQRFIQEIEGYHGEYIVESFNPLCLRTVMKSKPGVLRGILSTEYSKDDKYKDKFLYMLLENLLLNFLMRPDFIAYSKDGYRANNLRFIRKVFGTPLFAWTVRSVEEEAAAIGAGFDSVIFENYIPEK